MTGTNKRSVVILDALYIDSEGRPKFYEQTDSKKWGDRRINANIDTAMYDYLYRNARLADICEYITMHKDINDTIIIDFVIDRNRLSYDFVAEMNERFPGNSLMRCLDWTPCRYCNCIGLNNYAYRIYRDNSGCTGLSWEHPFIMRLDNEACSDIREIAQTQGAVQAGIMTIKTAWGETRSA